jgi:predicted nucleic-acid-binding protein
MIAFDTNLLVRIVINDDQQQADIAEQLLNTHQVFISRTVLLETEWVLRAAYKQSKADIATFVENILVTQNIVVENAVEIHYALEWYRLGADFADAVHLCICGEKVFYTFDQRFCKEANKQGITPLFKVIKR